MSKSILLLLNMYVAQHFLNLMPFPLVDINFFEVNRTRIRISFEYLKKEIYKEVILIQGDKFNK